MKTKLTSRAAAIAAFVSLIQVAHAKAVDKGFTPLEYLPPEQRQQIVEKLNELTQIMEVDWDRIAVGINKNGEIILVPKTEANLGNEGTPSCFARAKKA